MYSLGQQGRMWWGKIRRAFLIAFRKDRVAEKLDRRRGACSRCGACCKIVFRCPAYDDSNGEPRCLIYNDRPGVCGLFPLDEKDLRDRDIVMADKKCGYFFVDAPTPAGNGSEPREAMAQPIRWGPPKGANGKTSAIKGTIKILWSFIRKPSPNGTGQP
ncbi:MAG TPA: hypothetical protein VJB14_03995 [Planctomycetota bacterium]|nr:hypothetical protein [Planctomycetota bacterium]